MDPQLYDNERLIFMITQAHPAAVHGRDYWVAQYVDEETDERTGDAFIVDWRLAAEKPDEEALLALREATGSAWEAEVARRVRDARLPPLTRRQLRLMLLQIGMTVVDVEDALGAIEDPGERAAAHIEWEDATQYIRDHPLVVLIGDSLGFTPTELDDIWAYAVLNM